ncbi:MAG: hypothetical protein QGG20_06360 [Dehalococcoidia bacterium]|jgi:hypothetical protein|nr:hypothetical protein [Dehalococcoidia bacterium]
MERLQSTSPIKFLPVLLGWMVAVSALFLGGSWPILFDQLNSSFMLLMLLGAAWIGMGVCSMSWHFHKRATTNNEHPPVLIELVAILLPLLLFWNIYAHILGNWFSYDDTDILHYVDVIGPFAGFYSPELKYNFFTPMQQLSLRMDYFLFGFDPSGFYWHHLISLTLMLLLFYRVLRFFVAPIYASMIVALFVVALPTAQITNWLMVRHYVEGLVFSLLSLLAFEAALRTNRFHYALLGGLLYFLASISKETYVPLLLILPCLPLGSITQRLRFTVPYLVMAAIYTLMRVYMLGDELLTGYNSQVTTLGDFAAFPENLADKMGWRHWWQVPILLILAGGLLLVVHHHWKISFSLIIALLVATLFPLIPVIGRLTLFAYYLFLVCLVFSIATMFGMNALTEKLAHLEWQRPAILGFFLIVLVSNLIPTQLEQARLKAALAEQRIQEEFLLQYEDDNAVIIYDSYIADDLVHFRQQNTALDDNLKWCSRNDCLCAQQYSELNALAYESNQWVGTPLSSASCSTLEPDRNLTARFTITLPDKLAWELGPYSPSEGSYFIAASMDEFSNQPAIPKIIPVPATGIFDFCCSPFAKPFTWTVHYMSTEGWELVSEPIQLNANTVNSEGIGQIVWERAANGTD